MASIKSAHELLGAEIKDLYSAEKQLTKAIPKLIAGAKNPELKAGLSAHLDETRQQVVRLETIAGILDIKASGQVCRGMEGIIDESAERLSMESPAVVSDLDLIAAARRVEHYEIAGYLTAIALADGLHLTEVTKLLQESLYEEKGAEQSLQRHFGSMLAASAKEGGPGKPASAQTHNAMAKTA